MIPVSERRRKNMKTIKLTEEQAVIVMHALQTEGANISKDIASIQMDVLDRENVAITDDEVKQIEDLKARQAAIGEIVDILYKA